ncbi:MAG: Endonuclease MutS2 [Deltaproteobacteria bacterium]|jgi:DNA-nicking Smr family endonuclease|nr:Endonuclease MutS2 [Deltaproteobacteria bacterium]
MGRKSSTSSNLTFEESDQDDALMKQIFDNVKDVPDKESPPDQTAEQSSPKKTRTIARTAVLRPDDELDLHGKTREEAIMMVQKFVADCYRNNFRTALIITGKGHHSAEQTPVLKREVKLWLERNGASYIRDFEEAPPRFGGSGAIWLNFK